eukprot:GHRR01008549.1.p3 GENE.GHRR01008549.1~~GHRR01008549.1.p3  ORF type:complete len:112 (+),score=15.60 GHRR01008549.1:2462-2797(+)
MPTPLETTCKVQRSGWFIPDPCRLKQCQARPEAARACQSTTAGTPADLLGQQLTTPQSHGPATIHTTLPVQHKALISAPLNPSSYRLQRFSYSMLLHRRYPPVCCLPVPFS